MRRRAHTVLKPEKYNEIPKTLINDYAIPALFLSGAYMLAYFVTVAYAPVFSIGGPVEAASSASLIFLPHGVRVIGAWLYGWRAILFLLPGTYLTHLTRFHHSDITLPMMIAPMTGVVCASICFGLLAAMGADLRLRSGRIANWRDIILTGAAASVLNAAGTSYFYGNPLNSAAAYFIGDLIGMLAMFMGLMMTFRLMRRYGY